MRLDCLAGIYAVARGAAATPIPVSIFGAPGLVSVNQTADELSAVAPAEALDPAVFEKCEPGWRAFCVAGPLDFAMTGVMAELSQTLAAAGISLFAISTYDTDYILVRAADAQRAAQAWRASGHDVRGL